MATIPRLVASRGLDPGGVVQMPTGDPVGAALEQAGTKLQSVVERFTERKLQQERFESLIGFDEFGNKLAGEVETSKQTMKPGAAGLHDTLLETYDKRSAEWLTTLPESQRSEFAARVKAKRESFSLGVAKIENDESQRFQASGIEKRVTAAKNTILQTGPDAVEPFQRDVDELIDSSILTPIQKEEAKKKIRTDLQEAGFRSLAARDPHAAQLVAAGWGAGSAAASQREREAVTFFQGKGLSPVASAALVGRLSHESGGMNPEAMNKGDGRDGSDSVGLAQWNAERKAALKSFANARGKPMTDFNTQLEFAWSELSGSEKKALQGLQSARTPEEAARAALDFERPKGWKPDGSHRNEEVAGWRDQLGRTRAIIASTGEADKRFADIPAERRLVLAGAADLEMRKQTAEEAAAATKVYNERFNALQTDVIDGKATMADVQKARADGWLSDAGDIQRVSSQIATRDKGMADTANFGRAMADPAFVWNSQDKSQQDWADAGFKSLGGNMQALEVIAGKTGIVPESAAVALRGNLYSGDAQRAGAALQTASSLVSGRYPDIFSTVDNGKELTDSALAFREYVYGRGMTAANATKRVMEEATPEFQRNIKAKIKKEDLDLIVKKNLSDSDIRSAFDTSFLGLAPNPGLTFNPEMRQRAMGDYEAEFRDQFMRNGDVGLSKTLALESMKRTYGVTSVNGSSVIMKYPPDRSRAYSGIQDPAGRFAQQAIAAIKETNGVDVDRKNLIVMEGRGTAERYVKGQPPTYTIAYTDKNGLVQQMPRQFYADPAAMRNAQTEERAADFTRSERTLATNVENIDLDRAPLGVRPF